MQKQDLLEVLHKNAFTAAHLTCFQTMKRGLFRNLLNLPAPSSPVVRPFTNSFCLYIAINHRSCSCLASFQRLDVSNEESCVGEIIFNVVIIWRKWYYSPRGVTRHHQHHHHGSKVNVINTPIYTTVGSICSKFAIISHSFAAPFILYKKKEQNDAV